MTDYFVLLNGEPRGQEFFVKKTQPVLKRLGCTVRMTDGETEVRWPMSSGLFGNKLSVLGKNFPLGERLRISS
jgi:hypothetical protein